MKWRTRKASWFVRGLLLLAVMSAGFRLVVAQSKSETSRTALDASGATFESLDDHFVINVNNVAYTSDDGAVFDIYFACSSVRGSDPLRFTEAGDISHARSYFNDEKRYGNHFIKINKYCVNVRNIAYVEYKAGAVYINFNIRICDDFVNLTLSGADAEAFRKVMRGEGPRGPGRDKGA